MENRNQNSGDSGSINQNRKWIRWQELTLAIAVIVACLGFFLFRQSAAGTGAAAMVYLESEQIMEIPLAERDDYRIDLAAEYGVPVSFEVRGGAIRYVDVTCPDHICEQTGFISSEGQTAVCMPNRVAVHIVGKFD